MIRKSLETIVESVKGADRALLTQFSDLAAKMEKTRGFNKQYLSSLLSAASTAGYCFSFFAITPYFESGGEIPVYMVPEVLTGVSFAGLSVFSQLRSVKTEQIAAASRAKDFFAEKIRTASKAARLPTFLAGTGQIAYSAFQMLSYGPAALSPAGASLLLGAATVTLGVAMYINDSDPKLLDKAPAKSPSMVPARAYQTVKV